MLKCSNVQNMRRSYPFLSSLQSRLCRIGQQCPFISLCSVLSFFCCCCKPSKNLFFFFWRFVFFFDTSSVLFCWFFSSLQPECTPGLAPVIFQYSFYSRWLNHCNLLLPIMFVMVPIPDILRASAFLIMSCHLSVHRAFTCSFDINLPAPRVFFFVIVYAVNESVTVVV